MNGWEWLNQGDPLANMPAPAAPTDTSGAYDRRTAAALPAGTDPRSAYQPAGGSVESQVYNGLIQRGMTPDLAAAWVLNFKDESGLDPGINEIAPIVPGSRGGYGLYQLTGPRRRQYEAYAAERGLPLDSVDAQLDFMMTELQGPEARAWGKIQAAGNTGDAAAAIVTHFLRPADEHRERRVAKYRGASYQPPQGPAGMPENALATGPSMPMPQGQENALAQPQWQYKTTALDPAAFARPLSNALFRPI